MINATAVRGFISNFRGQVILPGDAGYETARHVWNRFYDKQPALIARCASTQDVVLAIEFARLNNLVAAVRSGGHSHAGHSTCDGGIVIDLGAIDTIEVDAPRRTVSVGAGAKVGDLNRAISGYDLAITSGTCPTVAIGGLTIAGGQGDLMGKFGLTCDHLIEAEVVLADGRVLKASEAQNPDLFWAIRGGHGNFGVVTSLLFRLHPLNRVLRGTIIYPLSDIPRVMRLYRDFTRVLPDELTTSAGIIPLPKGPGFAISACHSGNSTDGERALAPLRSFGGAISDNIRDLPYLESQKEAYVAPFDGATFQKSGFLTELTDHFIDTMAAHLAHAPSGCVAMMNHLHGAMARVGAADTAFWFRRNGYDFWITSDWDDPARAGACIAWVEDFWKDVEPVTTGAYVGGLGEESAERVRAAYGGNYPRLLELKRRFDPGNFFRLNQNISI